MEKQNQTQTQTTQMEGVNAIAMYFDSDKFAIAQRVCMMLASSDLVPKEYQYKPVNYILPDGSIDQIAKAQDDAAKSKAMANCMIALNKAALLKTDPLTIMQNMGIVYGRPSWASSFLIGSVNSSGRFMPLKFRFGEDGRVNETYTVYKKNGGGQQKTIDMPNMTCVAYTTERGDKEVLEGTEISIRMAFEENWIQKDGSKWLTMPKQMLMYRAAAFWQRAYCPEILQGLMTAEESEDIGYTDYEDIRENAQRQIAENANSGAAIGFETQQPQQQQPAGQQQQMQTPPPPQQQQQVQQPTVRAARQQQAQPTTPPFAL